MILKMCNIKKNLILKSFVPNKKWLSSVEILRSSWKWKYSSFRKYIHDYSASLFLKIARIQGLGQPLVNKNNYTHFFSHFLFTHSRWFWFALRTTVCPPSASPVVFIISHIVVVVFLAKSFTNVVLRSLFPASFIHSTPTWRSVCVSCWTVVPIKCGSSVRVDIVCYSELRMTSSHVLV